MPPTTYEKGAGSVLIYNVVEHTMQNLDSVQLLEECKIVLIFGEFSQENSSIFAIVSDFVSYNCNEPRDDFLEFWLLFLTHIDNVSSQETGIAKPHFIVVLDH